MSIEVQSDLFAGDSRANPTRWQAGTEKARKMTARSGRKCFESYGKFSQIGSLAKMFLGSSEWNSTTCFLTWKARSTSRHLIFRIWIIGRAKRLADASSERMEGNGAAGFEKPRASPGAEISRRYGPRSGTNEWEAIEPVDRVVDGFPGRMDELRSLGNAVCPQLVSEIGRLIMQHDIEYAA